MYEEIRANCRDERMKDRDIKNMIGRKFNVADGLNDRFEEHVQSGHFMESVMR